MELNNIKENAKLLVKDWLENIFAKMEILENENLVEKGLSSIQVMQLSGKLKKTGVKISFAKLMEKPVLSKWFELIDKSKVKSDKNIESSIIQSDEIKFDLTDVQYSYLIGREDDQILGGVGCHAYLEIDGKNIEADRLKAAWNKLQYRHPMLRVKFTKDGHQEILDKPYSEEIEVIDLADFDEETLHLKLVEIREQKSHRKLNVNQGQVAGVALAKFSDGKSRIFFDVDLLVSDVMSMSIMIKELAEIYSGVELDNLNEYTFKDYMQNGISELINDADKEFWEQKINSFEVERPNLPLRKQPEQIKETKFKRRKRIIKKEEWETIKDIAASYQSTPSMVLLTAYALVLERWCNQSKFFINIPLFNRDLENEYLKDMVADFTNILLVEHEVTDDSRFLDTLRRINKTFLENVSHSAYSGVQVQRNISKNQGTSVNIAPVVFACNIDYPLETRISRENLGEISYMISQTPGVWLDFQTYIVDDNLILCWDSVDELFPTGMLDDMMDSLYELIISLTQKGEWEKKVDVLPEKQKSIRKQDVEEILPIQYPNETLYDGFIKNVKLNPDKVAIIDSETKEQITYYKLYEISLKVADCLNKNGVKKGDYVGITLPRDSRQLYAIFGVLFAGAAYVSIGIAQPNDRRTKIYDQIGIKYIISDEKTIKDCGLNKSEVKIIDLDEAMANESKLEQPIEISPYDSAYIIMTSGTTGVPKGVEIMHTSAINTCIDLNEKYKVNAKDTILMVSAIDFDLSVYDIFGILRAGGTIVTTSKENYRNPDEWLNLVDEYKVTIWDSVPILFDMIVTMAEGKNRKLPFRIVMLSGDWIAINLPERFYNISSKNINSIVVAMGGATEASIWSNYLNVPREIPKDWISIPYGRPLKNQVYRVVDEFCRICPNYVKGELLIGGVGVAKCYHGDEELTNKKYFEQDGIRWYRTGDNGRTWNDGTIEFMGRKDSQIKIKGYRIELGEIESSVDDLEYIDNAIVYAKDNEIIVAYKLKESSKANKTIEKYNVDEIFIDRKVDNKIVEYIGILCILKVFAMLKFEKELIEDFNIKLFAKNVNIKKEYACLLEIWIKQLYRYKILNENEKISDFFEKISMAIHDIQRRYLIEIEKVISIDDINSSCKSVISVITGKMEKVELIANNDFKLTPKKINYGLSNASIIEEKIRNTVYENIEKIFKEKSRKINILEIGGRGSSGICFDDKIAKYIDSYTYIDESMEFVEKIKYREINNIMYKKMNLNDFIFSLSCGIKKFDLVIALDSLHRVNNIDLMLTNIGKVLLKNGLFILVEPTKTNPLIYFSVGFLENKFDLYCDERKKERELFYSFSKIISKISCKNYCFEEIKRFESFDEKTSFVLRNKNNNISESEIAYELANSLPKYMIPNRFIEIDYFPVNNNGKIDRNKISTYINDKFNYNRKGVTASTPSELMLVGVLKDILNIEEVYLNDNFFGLGGDSLIALKLTKKIKEVFSVDVSMSSIFNSDNIGELLGAIESNKCKNFTIGEI